MTVDVEQIVKTDLAHLIHPLYHPNDAKNPFVDLKLTLKNDDLTPFTPYAEKFAAAHKVDLPFVLDPGGKLAAEVNADRDLGKAIKLDHTPTVYIVSSRNPSRPYVEVKDNSQLYSTIDAVMKE